MNLAREIVTQILHSGDIEPYLEAGITGSWLHDKASHSEMVFEGIDRQAYTALLEHNVKHGCVPSIDVFRKDFPAASYRLSGEDYKPSELIELALREVRGGVVSELVEELVDLHDAADYEGVSVLLRGHADSIDGLSSPGTTGNHSGTWQPVDLAQFLDADRPRLMPTIGARDDGVKMLYPGRTNALVGESEAGKSWVALKWAADEIDAGHDVGYIDFEDGADGIMERLIELVDSPRSIVEHLRYIHPESPLTDAMALADSLADCSLVVLDGITEAMDLIPTDGRRVNVADWNAMYVRFQNTLMSPIANRGPAVLCIDHPPKGTPAARGGSGAGHKLRGLSGASYTVVNEEPMGRGRCGRSRIYVGKDRHGFVRTHAGMKDDKVGLQPIACLVVDNSDEEHATEVYLQPDSDGWQPTTIMQRVSQVLAAAEGPLSKNAITKLTGTAKQATLKAVDQLESGGFAAKRPGGYVHVRRYLGE